MKRSYRIAAGIVVSLGLGVAAFAYAQHGPMAGAMMGGMMGGMGGGMGPGMMHRMGPMASASSVGMMGGAMAAMHQGDGAAAADMTLVHQMLANHEQITRTVTNLPDGIRTVTESTDPQVAQAIQAHVASMNQRLADGREFNLFSKTIPVLFENRDKIRTAAVVTAQGTTVTQTSTDPAVVAALQAHAVEVSELARDGMVAMRRGAMAAMAGMMPRGARNGFRPGAAPAPDAPGGSHTH